MGFFTAQHHAGHVARRGLEEHRVAPDEKAHTVERDENGQAGHHLRAGIVGAHLVAPHVVVNQRGVNEAGQDGEDGDRLPEDDDLDQGGAMIGQDVLDVAVIADLGDEREADEGLVGLHPVQLVRKERQETDGEEIDNPSDGDVDAHLLLGVAPLVRVEQVAEWSEPGIEIHAGGADDQQIDRPQFAIKQAAEEDGGESPERKRLSRQIAFLVHLANAQRDQQDHDEQQDGGGPIDDRFAIERHAFHETDIVEAAQGDEIEGHRGQVGAPGHGPRRASPFVGRNDLLLQWLHRGVEIGKGVVEEENGQKRPEVGHERHEDETQRHPGERSDDERLSSPEAGPDAIREEADHGLQHNGRHGGQAEDESHPGGILDEFLQREDEKGPHDGAVKREGGPGENGERDPPEGNVFLTGDDHGGKREKWGT